MKLVFLIPPLILVVALFLVFSVVKNRADFDIPGDHPVPLLAPIITSYTPKHDFINIITLRLKNASLADTGNYRMSLLDESGQVVKSVDFSGRNVGDPSDLRLQFEPLGNSLQVRSLKLEPLTDSKLQVYVDRNDRISFTAYYRRAPGLGLPDISFINRDRGFFMTWLVILGFAIWASKRYSRS